MTIFKETVDSQHLTTAETKAVLEELETERAGDDREVTYELARAIEHANQFALLTPDEAQTLVEELADLEKVDEETAYKIADLRPQTRTELRAVFAKNRYSLDGEELDAILNVIAQYT